MSTSSGHLCYFLILREPVRFSDIRFAAAFFKSVQIQYYTAIVCNCDFQCCFGKQCFAKTMFWLRASFGLAVENVLYLLNMLSPNRKSSIINLCSSGWVCTFCKFATSAHRLRKTIVKLWDLLQDASAVPSERFFPWLHHGSVFPKEISLPTKADQRSQQLSPKPRNI